MTISDEDLYKLLELEAKATPGPWFATDARNDVHGLSECRDRHGVPILERTNWTVSRKPDEAGWCTDMGYDGYGIGERDARCAAAARNNLRPLIEEVKRLRGLLETVADTWRRDWDCSATPGHDATGELMVKVDQVTLEWTRGE